MPSSMPPAPRTISAPSIWSNASSSSRNRALDQPGFLVDPEVIGRDDQHRVEGDRQLGVGGGAQARGERAGERLGCAGELIDDAADAFAGEQRDRVLVGGGTRARRASVPSTRLRARRSSRCTCRAGRAWRDRPRPGRPPPTLRITSCSARPMVALARLPGPSALIPLFMPIASRDRTVDHDDRSTEPGGGEQPVHVELVGARGLDRGDDHGQILRSTPGHHRVDRDLLDGAFHEVGRDDRDDLLRVAGGAGEHPHDTRAAVGGTSGRPSDQPRSNMASASSSSSPSSTRRACSWRSPTRGRAGARRSPGPACGNRNPAGSGAARRPAGRRR